jgi:DNA-binding transcriptional regulator YiaG
LHIEAIGMFPAIRRASKGAPSMGQYPDQHGRDRETDSSVQDLSNVTGPELRQLRQHLGDAIGKSLSAADMAKLCGLAASDGADTIRRWEVSGPSGPATELLRILAMASDRHPILDNFNVFDRFNIRESERPARKEAFREQMRNEVRRRLG